MYSIATRRLSYRFSSGNQVLDNIELAVPEGSIYGFLGPNGAGKTTTLRLLLGLLEIQQGDIEILGRPMSTCRRQVLRSVGSFIETPSLYSQLTATENLEVYRRIYQCDKSSVPEALSTVGLAGAGNKKAGKLSLGMKQRLSIAIALLHQPSLLILDEPTNGLDPQGIIDIRELLKQLNREKGVTIVVSSHLLAEIEKTVTHAGIICEGRLLFQGRLDALAQSAPAAATVFHTSDLPATERIIGEAGLLPEVWDSGVMVPTTDPFRVAAVNELLVERQISVYGIVPRSQGLESIFMDLLKNNQ